jgi:hypothetical protein
MKIKEAVHEKADTLLGTVTWHCTIKISQNIKTTKQRTKLLLILSRPAFQTNEAYTLHDK